MPRIKRWFHVSHEINSDEEVWELTDRWKAWGLRVWLQLLSIADRNEGRIKGDLALISRSMSRLWDSNSRRYNSEWRANEARIMLEWMQNKGWISIESDAIVVCNWLIYNPRRELLSFPPNHPIPPILTKPKEKIIHPILSTVLTWPHPQLLIDKYNAETPEQLPAVEKVTPARLRKARDYLKIFSDQSFWTEAFQEIGKSDFLLGLKASNGHESFKANFDWLLTKGKDGTENVVKVFEGRYRNGSTQTGYANGQQRRY